MFRRFAIFLLFSTSVAAAEPLPCALPSVMVDTEDAALHQRVCAIAEQAIPKLAACGLPQQQNVTFLFDAPALNTRNECFGLYHKGQNRIVLRTPEAFRQIYPQSSFCDGIPADALFDSVVVHELTHALLDQSADSATARRADFEFVAYAMQIDSLPPATRAAFLDRHAPKTPGHAARINEVVLDLSPPFFAAAAWLYFASPSNGCDLVGRIARGEHRFEKRYFP